MRPHRLLVPVLGLPALAFAQDTATPDPVGTLLQDALPPGADLVVHVPSVPRFLESAKDAGFGTPETWRETFRAQLRRWGQTTGDTDRLIRGAEALLAAADGEAVAAAMEVPGISGAGGGPRARAGFFAFRSRAKEKELRAAVDDVIAGGLRGPYPGEPRVEQTMGRGVIALAGAYDGLWIRVQDHLVAVADHPLALGLFFRGMERVAREGRPPEDVSPFRLRVRWGRSDSPLRWEGTTFLQREAVTAGTKTLAGGTAALPQGPWVVSYLVDEVKDLPLFPARVPEDLLAKGRAMNARPLSMGLRPDGTWDCAGSPPAPEGSKPVVGGAARGGWLRAMHEGVLAVPFGLDPDLIAKPLAEVEAAKDEVSAPFADWRPGSEAGELRGPAWHGPVTFLALRTLSDIVRRQEPNAPPPAPPAPPPKPDVNLPPPVPGRPLSAPGAAPVKPGKALPAPEEK